MLTCTWPFMYAMALRCRTSCSAVCILLHKRGLSLSHFWLRKQDVETSLMFPHKRLTIELPVRSFRSCVFQLVHWLFCDCSISPVEFQRRLYGFSWNETMLDSASVFRAPLEIKSSRGIPKNCPKLFKASNIRVNST